MSNFGSTCIVIAHPDDESLFFTPIIQSLNKKNNLYLLCLTNGNYYGFGKEREKELVNACKSLGIKEKNIKIVNNELIQDQPHYKWKCNIVIREIESFVDSNRIETIFTFDEFGISKHVNHISVNEAITEWLKESKRDYYPNIYVLLSSNLLVKYSGVLSWIYCLFSNSDNLNYNPIRAFR
ncbi:hypothetical protein RS030_3454 [Cryptosporidium xiaoi]|uniref:N-acetylglucosaminylphosphatidylinositol deacetylase n=1 Tax=Cryptosporidium xiaoi TaxID=659607 RepID=A0AAV9XVU0_9CRYT